ncbi:MAG: TonB-dependent receptor [Prevotella sp.]|nr:TonB-dependent receptor [Prevotella sp.]
MHNLSGYRLNGGMKKASMALGLAASLLLPLNAMAEAGSVNAQPAAVQQAKTVKGHVVDEFGDPMIGVTVKVKGTQTGVVTDLNGDFNINTGGKPSLELSYVGYLTMTVQAKGTQILQIAMKPDNKMMDEVLVIGYGTVKKRDALGAISQVKAEDIKQAPVLNAMEGLSGKIAGLDITRESGQAGSSPTILLRGNRSLTSNCAPLFVIDGVAGGSIDNLNPNDIESIEVLKDASSTAIYGAEGANGVVIVTTRQGMVGKTQVDFNAYVGINAFPSYPTTLSGQKWVDWAIEGYRASNRYMEEDEADIVYKALHDGLGLTDGAMQAYENNQWVNWRDEILQTGVQQNYNISVRGGTEKSQSYVSAGYQQEKGLYRKDKAEALNFRAGSNYQVNKIVSIGFQTTIAYKNRDRRNSRLSKSLTQLPLGQVWNEDGSLKIYPIDDMNSYVNIMADDVPYAYQHNTKSTSVNIAPFIELKPLKGLSFKSLVNASVSNNRSAEWDGMNTYMELTGSQSPNQRSATYSNGNGWGYSWQNVLNYNFKVADIHDITLTGVTEYGKSTGESSNMWNEQFDFDESIYYNFTGTDNKETTTKYTETSKMSYALRAAYNLMGRYLLSASVRWDGSSVLDKDHRWHSFPAASVGWRISDEPFMKSTQSWLDNLKLRVGYGVTGNSNISPYSSLQMVEPSATHITLGDTDVTPYKLTEHVTNPLLSWEKSYNWNFGLDFGFLGGRIDGSLEYYTTDTKDVLYDRPLPTAYGVYNAKTTYKKTSNIARIKNRGVELTLNTRNIVKKNFTWTSTFTFAKNKEELTEINLGNNVSVENLVALNLFLGQPVNTFYGYKKLGIWQKDEEEMAKCMGNEVGTVKVEIPRLVWDPNYTYQTHDDDGNVTGTYTGAYYVPGETDDDGNQIYYTRDNTYVVNANTDRQILGARTPDWNIGFQNQFTFYGFDLSIMMNMRWGQMINGELLSYVGGSNQPEVYDYWTEQNPTNAYPRPIQGYSMTTAQKESMYYVNGSFFKVKNITLGYTFGRPLLRKLGMTKLRLYGTITNPLILSKEHKLLKGMDPESNASDKFPLYKTIVFGANISF